MSDKNKFTEKDVERLHRVLDKHKQAEREQKKARKPSTPTGLSLIDIALKLKQQHPDLSVDDAKKQAKDIQKAQEHINYGGSKLRHTLYTSFLGKNLGDRIARYRTDEKGQEEAHDKLAEFHKAPPEPPSEEKKLLHEVVEKLDSIEKEIKAIKIEPPAATPVAEVPVKQSKATKLTPAIQDAHLALQGLGYKKQTVKDMLHGLPDHATTEEAIRYGLAKDKKSVQIPQRDVPQVAQETAHQLRQEKAEIAKVAVAPPTAPTKIEGTPPPPPVDSLKKPEKSNLGADSQKKAAEWEKLRAEQEAAIKRQKRMDFLIGVVEDIRKAVHGKGLFPFIAGLLALAAKGIVKTALKLLAKGALKLISTMTKLVWSAMKTIGTSILKMVAKGWEAIKAGTKFVGEEVAKGGEAVMKLVGKEGAKLGEKGVLKSVLKKIPIVGAIAGLGFGAYEASKGNFAGAGLEAASGLASTLPGLGTAASLGLDVAAAVQENNFENKSVEPAAPAADTTKNVVKGSAASTQAEQMKPDETQNDLLNKIIGDEGSESESMAPAPPVIIAPQTHVSAAPKKDDSQPIIQVHNMESSVAAYLASIFDHPVFFTSLGGM